MAVDEIDLEELDVWSSGPPHSAFRALRATSPVHWHARPHGTAFWAVTRHAEALEVLGDAGLYSSARGGVSLHDLPAGAAASFRAMLPYQDPPEHTATRKLVAAAFRRRAVASLEGPVRERAAAIVERARELSSCDFVDTLAAELPLQVIAELMGVPQSDRHLLRHFSDRITDGEVEAGAAGLGDYLRSLIAERRARPLGDDLVAVLLRARIDGRALPEDDVAAMLVQIAQGGNETLRGLFSLGMLALLERPAEAAALRREPSLLPAAIEEMLRFTSPVLHLRRTATRDAVLAGQRIRAGDRVVVFLVSVNRDERVFRDPDRFDFRRPLRRNLALGSAQHFCLGAHVARLESRIFFEELFARTRRIEQAGAAVRVRSLQSHGLLKLPVTIA